jgi:hypothetical protein
MTDVPHRHFAESRNAVRRLFAILLLTTGFSLYAADTSNTIVRDEFNFGHQVGYMYSRMDDAYFMEQGNGNFTTGFLALYTPVMPLVRNPYWKERTILLIPLYLEYFPCSKVALQAEITDLFIEFPYQSTENMGGKSPRFKTKIKLLDESAHLPALAFTVGVKFSSAKPYTIWRNNHNYDESNGLAGAGTGVADYLLLFTASRHLSRDLTAHARIGLAPIGSPVEYTRGSAQADEIPYGIALKKEVTGKWSAQLETSGMYNGLRSTALAHYSVARLQVFYHTLPFTLTFDFERGLTKETDTWVAGFYARAHFKAKARR